MEQVAILGGSGIVGKEIARLLLRRDDLGITLMGRTEQKLLETAASLAGENRVQVRAVDATKREELAGALADCDLVVVAAPLLDQIEAVADAALASRTNWLDCLVDTASRSAIFGRLGPQFAEAGLRLISGAGIHPGIAAPLIRYATDRNPALTTAEVGVLFCLDWAKFPVTEATAREMVVEFTNMRCTAWVDGQYQSYSWIDKRAVRKIDFGHPFGVRFCAAMELDEIVGLPTRCPKVRNARMSISGFTPLFDYLAMPLGITMAKLSRRLVAPVGKFWLRTLKRSSKPPFGTVVRLEASGPDQAEVQLTLRHGDAYWLTSAAATATAYQLIDSVIDRPGFSPAGLAVDPEVFLADLEAFGTAVEKNGLS